MLIQSVFVRLVLFAAVTVIFVLSDGELVRGGLHLWHQVDSDIGSKCCASRSHEMQDIAQTVYHQKLKKKK